MSLFLSLLLKWSCVRFSCLKRYSVGKLGRIYGCYWVDASFLSCVPAMSIQSMKADVMGQRMQDVDEKLLFVMFSACLCYSLMGQSSGIWEGSLTLVLVIMGMVFAMALSIMLWKPNNALSSNSWVRKPGFWEAYYHLTGLLGCGIIISYCHLWAKGLWELWRLWRILNWATHEALGSSTYDSFEAYMPQLR